MFAGRGAVEALPHNHDVLAIAFAPSGKQLAAATLNGDITFWDPHEATLLVGGWGAMLWDHLANQRCRGGKAVRPPHNISPLFPDPSNLRLRVWAYGCGSLWLLSISTWSAGTGGSRTHGITSWLVCIMLDPL